MLGAFLLFFSRASQSGQVSVILKNLFMESARVIGGSFYLVMTLFQVKMALLNCTFFYVFSSKLGGASGCS